jgi:2-polyprenyl-6-methoxyphenol hydroxylase-like FAD-dependent oxidoreductase
MNRNIDVVVVGSGPAGCTTAILLGRAGLTVALLEAHRDPSHYKRLCTHSIRSSATPTLRRLGLDAVLDGLNAVHHRESGWSKRGWLHERADAMHGYNIRRITLDPVLRATAAETPGVELVMGAKVRELTADADGRVSGVVAEIGGEHRRFGSRLVIGADGYTSKVAELAGLPGRVSANNRFGYQAGYQNVELPPGWTGALWFQEPRLNVNAIFFNNDGVAMLAAFHLKDRLAEFKRDREAALLGSFANLTDAPDLSKAERVTNVIGTTDYPSITRRHMVRPGVALVGDAAMVGDPLNGTGCGWAFQSAEWLADTVADPLRSGGDTAIDAGARQYQRIHRRKLLPHQLTNIALSQAATLNPLMRTIYGAAPHDQKVADRVFSVATRNSSPLNLLDPFLLTRAVIASRKTTATRQSSMPATGTF